MNGKRMCVRNCLPAGIWGAPAGRAPGVTAQAIDTEGRPDHRYRPYVKENPAKQIPFFKATAFLQLGSLFLMGLWLKGEPNERGYHIRYESVNGYARQSQCFPTQRPSCLRLSLSQADSSAVRGGISAANLRSISSAIFLPSKKRSDITAGIWCFFCPSGAIKGQVDRPTIVGRISRAPVAEESFSKTGRSMRNHMEITLYADRSS